MKASHAGLLLLSLTALFLYSSGEEVQFGNRVYTVAEPGACTDADYTDAKQTGSYLLSTKGKNSALMTLSMDIQLVHYRVQSSAKSCFRAHPAFITCIQKALTDLKSTNRAIVTGGYRLPADVRGSTDPADVFAAAGTAINLVPVSRDPADLMGIARAILTNCPAPLERIGRNLGIVMKQNSVVAFMGGPSDPPLLSVNGYTVMSQAAFNTEALAAINAGLELGKPVTECSLFPTLSAGQWYPENSTGVDSTVGSMDMAVTRDTSSDFARLVEYMGVNVLFDKATAWCGQAGQSCAHCQSGPVDARTDKRCTARMMTSRMSEVLVRLQKLVREKMADGVLVLEGWDEDYPGHVAADSMHREGRALKARLTSGNSGALNQLANLAICAKADYVRHNNDHILLAVQKQHGSVASLSQFAKTALVRVETPSTKEHLVQLPSYFSEADHAQHPVFDSAGREDLEIARHTRLGYFVSPLSRYLRLSRHVADCFSTLQDYFVQRQSTDGPVRLEVVRGFLTTPERDETLKATDSRYASGILGQSFEIRADASQSSVNVSLATLARLAVIRCTPEFKKAESEIGVGLYQDRVFVDMRDEFKFWNPSGSFPPQVKSAAEFRDYMQQLFSAAYDGRIIDPDLPAEAEVLAEPPSRQSVVYRYTVPERVHRRRSTATGATECQPKRDTPFCQLSERSRRQMVFTWWQEAVKKHNYHDLNETKAAFDGCFGDCGTCLSGAVYQDKVEHCSNYLHWSPFEIVPPYGSTSNLFPRERGDLRSRACPVGTSRTDHCIEDSPLFLLVVNLFEASFRADPTRSVSQELYPQTENPSPVAELVQQLYVTHAQGKVKVWVHDETDISAMKNTLETLMVYNKEVTQVEVLVQQAGSKAPVDSVLRSLILEWTSTRSPVYSREFVAPYTLNDMPKVVRKRSAEAAAHDRRDSLIHQKVMEVDNWLSRIEL